MKCNYCKKNVAKEKEIKIKRALLVVGRHAKKGTFLPPSTIRSAEKLFVKKRAKK